MDRWLNAYHGTRKSELRDPDSLRRLRRDLLAGETADVVLLLVVP